jgi:hypothetical protein
MRLAFSLFAATVALSGCSLSAGAGVGARVGERPSTPSAECDGFESCDVAYQEALSSLEHCREEGEDCDGEERNVAESYGMLREQTQRELEALRSEAEEREGAVTQAEQAAEAARLEQKNCSPHAKPPEPPAVPHHGNGWVESEQPLGMH